MTDTYTDPDGAPIDVVKWASLHEVGGYGLVLAQHSIGGTIVRTKWFGLTVPELDLTPFGVAVATDPDGPWHHRHNAHSKPEALALHKALCERLRADMPTRLTVEITGTGLFGRLVDGQTVVIRRPSGRLIMRVNADETLWPGPDLRTDNAWVSAKHVTGLLDVERRNMAAALLELHPPLGPYCSTCGGTYPCATAILAQQWQGQPS